MTSSFAPTAATSPPKRFFWEDFPVGQVREFGRYPEAVLAFAREFDPQPFHLDDAAAEASLFGRLAASGWHTCAMAMRMMCDAYLTKPVYPGDTLHVRLEVLESRAMASRPDVGIIRSRWQVLNQADETVLTMEGFGMFGAAHAGHALSLAARTRCAAR